jgi:hypothetical protein
MRKGLLTDNAPAGLREAGRPVLLRLWFLVWLGRCIAVLLTGGALLGR